MIFKHSCCFNVSCYCYYKLLYCYCYYYYLFFLIYLNLFWIGCCAQVYVGLLDVTQLTLESRKCLESRVRQNSISGKDFGVKIPVAIKVLHPDVALNFSRDLNVLKSLVAFVSHLFPSLEWLSLKESIDEFASLMEIQVWNYPESRGFKTYPAILKTLLKGYPNTPKILFKG